MARFTDLILDRRLAGLRRALAALCVVALLAPAGVAAQPDTTPPKFAGLKSASTCIPGPIGGGRTSSYRLTWDAATDNLTPTRRILYDVYQATTSGGQEFSAPTYTTPPGATTFDTPPLPIDTTYFFVVRARDRAGNSDANRVERQGLNPCV